MDRDWLIGLIRDWAKSGVGSCEGLADEILTAHKGETFKYQEDINHDTKTIFVPPDRYFDLRGEADKQIAKRMIEEYMDATPTWAYLSLYDLLDYLDKEEQ